MKPNVEQPEGSLVVIDNLSDPAAAMLRGGSLPSRLFALLFTGLFSLHGFGLGVRIITARIGGAKSLGLPNSIS